MQLYIEVNVC